MAYKQASNGHGQSADTDRAGMQQKVDPRDSQKLEQRGGSKLSSQAGTCHVPFENDPPGLNLKNQPAYAEFVSFSRTDGNQGLRAREQLKIKALSTDAAESLTWP